MKITLVPGGTFHPDYPDVTFRSGHNTVTHMPNGDTVYRADDMSFDGWVADLPPARQALAVVLDDPGFDLGEL